MKKEKKKKQKNSQCVMIYKKYNLTYEYIIINNKHDLLKTKILNIEYKKLQTKLCR